MRNLVLIICSLALFIDVHAQCTLSATSSGYNASYTQVYVLVDQNGNIVDQNLTGTFNSVGNGVYQIHALNYDPLNPPAPLPADLIGMPLSDVGSIGSGCYNSDFLTDFVTQVCSSCQQNLDFCEGNPVIVTSSGSAAGYTQLYVLVDVTTDLIIATNGTGDFTSDVSAGNNYQVYALNYNPADAPNPLPTIGQGVMSTGNTYAGCYNSDFLIDYVCISILNTSVGTDTQTSCDSYLWMDGNTYTSNNNTATWTLTNAAGCDSIVTLDLTILNSNAGTDNVTACNSYTWIDGVTYNASTNTPTWTLTNSAGCDSVVTLNLTIDTYAAGTDTQIACDSYTWIDGNTYTSNNNSATYTYVGGSVNGCDSIVTLDLTLNNSNSGTDVIVACNSYTWIDGNTYTSNNNAATWTLTNVAGCDSVVTLNLTIDTYAAGTDVQTACDSYTWIDGNTYTSNNNSATYTYVGGSVNGCDSIVTLDLTLNNSNTGVDVVTACNSYTWIDGNTYTSSNNSATWTLTNVAGCDSIVSLDLTIASVVNGVDVQSACESFTWIDGITYTASTNTPTFTYTGGSVNGCDSIVTLNLTVNNGVTTTDFQTACDSFTWIDGINYTSSNTTATFTFVGGASNGCDSTVKLDLTIISTPGAPTAGTDSTYCSDWTIADLTAIGTGGTLTWYDSQNNVLGTGATLTPLNTLGLTEYYVTETVSGCEGSSSMVSITIEDCGPDPVCGELYIPTAFSPNGDDNNDHFTVLINPVCVETYQLYVFDRWGELVFESDDPEIKWDGTYKGRLLEPASFVYAAEIKLNSDTEAVKYSGSVLILK